jgi:hypothetical protein
VAEICDSIIWDLPQLSRVMLECRYIFGDAFRSNRPDADQLLSDAVQEFWSRARKVIW